jgi:hypothetical protein
MSNSSIFLYSDGTTSTITSSSPTLSFLPPIDNSTRQLVAVNIASNVTSIIPNYFQNRRELTSVIIPDSVTSIGPNCFFNCTKLNNVKLPNNSNFTTLEFNFFYNCINLEGIVIPNSVRTIQSGCFFNCRLNVIRFDNAATLTSVSTSDFQFNLIKEIRYNSKVESLSTAHVTLQNSIFNNINPRPTYIYPS